MTSTTSSSLLLPRADPLADPRATGVPAAAVARVLDELAARDVEMHSLMVVRHGHVVAEGWWAPYAPERVHLLYSLSKSFTSSAVGFCVAEGRFSLDARVVDLLPDHVPGGAELHPSVAALTVHHLLSMSTGHREDTLDRARALEPDDLVRGFLRLAPEEPVGSRHAYNNATTYALAAIVERHSGMPLLDYLRPRLLDPLGIGAARWDTDDHGQALGFTGLHLQTEAVAAFGQLLLQDGRWGGEQVLPPGWVELATQRHIDNDNDPEGSIDWRQGYGYQYWIARHGFRGDGAYGQFCVVVPESDLVVVTTACTEGMQVVLDVLWEQLLPALDQPVGDHRADDSARLRERLGALALPVVEAPDAGPADTTAFTLDAVGGEHDPFPPGTTMTVTADGEDSVVSVQLPGREGAPLAFVCGRDRWVDGGLTGPEEDPAVREPAATRRTPVVCRGGWTGATFEADLVLIETPHRIRLRGTDGRLSATWNAPPLTGHRIETQLPH
jgi:CubicO group peptidase (beta-lactamase class C family)